MKKPKRKHIPLLHPDTLEVLLQKVDSAKISTVGKRAVTASLQAAANPQAENPLTVIRSLPAERRESVQVTMQSVGRLSSGIISRGRTELMQMTEEDWQRLVGDANGDDTAS